MSFTKFLMNNLLVLQIVLFLSTLIVVSYWHQVSLYDPSHLVIIMIRQIMLFCRSLIYYLVSIIRNEKVSTSNYSFLRRYTSRPRPSTWILTRTLPSSIWRLPGLPWLSLWWQSVIQTIDLKLSKEEYVFVVLDQDNFEHVWIEVFFSAFIVLVINCVGVDFLYSIQRNCWDRSCQEANAVVMILVISKRSCRYLHPSIYKILFESRFKLQHFSFL